MNPNIFASVATMLALLPVSSLPLDEREHERNTHAKPPRYPQSYYPAYHRSDAEVEESARASIEAANAKRERKRAARLARKDGAE